MVWRNLDNKTRAYGTLVIFGIIAILFWYFSDSFSSWVSTTNPFLAMVVSIILNPAYIVLIYVLFNEYSWRGLFAGLLISISVDIMSLAHSIGKAGILPAPGPIYSYADTAIYKTIYPLAHSPIIVFLIYVILPIVLFYFALRIIRRTSSFNKIFKQAI